MSIRAEEFVEAAKNRGFQWYTGVPCSFLTPFINYTLHARDLHYISSANEGDALATAAGIVIGGQKAIVMMQNSGLGNAINPLTSLTHTFRIPLLIICTLRGDRALKDEPQHELMGQITDRLLDTMGIPWEYFPTETEAIELILNKAESYLETEKRPFALIMRKGSVLPHQLPIPRLETPKNLDSDRQNFSGEKHSRREILAKIIELTPLDRTIVIATTGYTGRELFALQDRHNHLYLVGSMGCASSLGLGLSLARPDLNIVVIDGDGAALMRMGNFATIGTYGSKNLTHILLDNEVHDSTGGQPTVSAGIKFAQIAQACGYEISYEGNEPLILEKILPKKSQYKPKFVHLKIARGTIDNLPRPNISPEQLLQRLLQHIKSI